MSVTTALEKVFVGTGEGPHWDSASQTLYMVDLADHDNKDGRIFHWNPSTKDIAVKSFKDSFATFIIPTTDGKCLISMDRSIAKYDWSTGEHEILHNVDQGKANRFNDGKCDPKGRLFAGTMSLEKSPAVLIQEKAGSLYSLDGNTGQLHIRDTEIDISNGLAWTADSRTFFFVDSMPRHVYAYDYDINSGDIKNRRIALDFSTSAIDDLAYPDGLAIDTRDRLWVACYKGSKVVCFDTTTGQRLQEIHLPTPLITSCCFGGPHLNEMFVTSGVTGLTDAERKAQNVGDLFKVTGLDAKGFPMVSFAC